LIDLSADDVVKPNDNDATGSLSTSNAIVNSTSSPSTAATPKSSSSLQSKPIAANLVKTRNAEQAGYHSLVYTSEWLRRNVAANGSDDASMHDERISDVKVPSPEPSSSFDPRIDSVNFGCPTSYVCVYFIIKKHLILVDIGDDG
jgi:hypothetical protein